MADYNKNNAPNNDPTGEVLSWVVVLILMFAFWPVGLFLLFRKLRGYAKPAVNPGNKNNAQTSYHTQQTARPAGDQVRRTANGAGEIARRAMNETGEAARRAAAQYSDYAKQVRTEVYSDVAREYSKSYAKKPKKKKDRTPLERKSGRFVSVILLLISIALFIIGANTISRAALDIWRSGLDSWRDLMMGVFYFAGAFISFFSRNIGVRRFSRYKKYYAFVSERGIVPISDIARASGQTVRVVIRDIQAMINDGYFGPGAYIDSELDSLVLYPEAAKDARQAARSDVEMRNAPPQSNDKPENQYMAIILELRDLNDAILDIPISDKIDRIEDLTAKIFRIVEENPEKLPQIRRFMNYYLPTTLKLLRSYATLEKQGTRGENITSAKENIGRILDTLATGFEQQLDQLFESDVIDIAADINVLENLMLQDGLTGDKPEMKVMEGSS